MMRIESKLKSLLNIGVYLGIFLITFVTIYSVAYAIYLTEAGSPYGSANPAFAPREVSHMQSEDKNPWKPALLFDKTKHFEYMVSTGTHELYVKFNVLRVIDQGLVVDSVSTVKRKADTSMGTRINWGGPRIIKERFTVDRITLQPLTATYNSALWNMHYWVYGQALLSGIPLESGAKWTANGSTGVIKSIEVAGIGSDAGRSFYILKLELFNGRKVMLWVGKETPAVLKYVEYTDKGEIVIESTLVN
jgi:hypothetical protein